MFLVQNGMLPPCPDSRIRWLWFKWAQPSKLYTGMLTNLLPTEQELFKACTMIAIGTDHNQFLE